MAARRIRARPPAGWCWADWPERARRHLPASDDGIDLVAEDTDGELVAVQVKFRSDPDRPVTREEAQKSLSYPDVFDRYLVVSNAWDRTRSATRGLAGEGRLSWVLRPHRPQIAHARDPRQRRPASGSGASYRTAVSRTVPTPRTIGIIVT